MKKSISTDMSAENITRVLTLLTETLQRLTVLSQGFTAQSAAEPLKAGDRSLAEIVAHILNCDERKCESIYAALLLHEPRMPDIHPERQWGALLHYEQYTIAELLAYFGFRRKTLLRVLGSLTEAQWSRTIRDEDKQRKESVYRLARAQALHEAEHLTEIETRFGAVMPYRADHV